MRDYGTIEESNYLEHGSYSGWIFYARWLPIQRKTTMHSNWLSERNTVRELHSSGLGGHFGKDNTLALIEDKYY